MSGKRRGRPRGPAQETKIIVQQAAGRLLMEEGPSALTAQRVHERTGIARTTIYRHWPQKSDLIQLAIVGATASHRRMKLTGELLHDLEQALGLLVFRLRKRPVRLFLASLIAAERSAPDLGEPSKVYVHGLLTPIRQVLEQGVDRGELREGDAATYADFLAGPLLLRGALLEEAITDELVATVLDDFLDRYGTAQP